MKTKHASKYNKQADNEELWSKQLGADPRYVRCASDEEEKELDNSLGLEVLTIRLDKKLMKQLKAAAKREGLYYIAYIRQILTAHAATGAVSKRRSA